MPGLAAVAVQPLARPLLAFNSLDAQRQAGLDYVASQRAQGWVALPDLYDDGGISGGTIDRPALQRLLEDITHGRIDVVVVYKVDRLSRSLTDFARLMQLFDEHKVSFVSVTQQFSTTSSMGRLTLNMLLSFAQFEREVAGERIRDKIAATKKQGIWVCGQPPLGFRLPLDDEDRRLRVVEDEASIIRSIFEGYLKLGSPIKLAEALNKQCHTTRRWQSSTGRWHGGKPFHAKFIHRALTNPVYLGKITHTFRDGRTEIYEGRHDAIIEQALWDRVHTKMKTTERATSHRWTHTHLLKGKLRTHEDYAMSPSSVQRPLIKAGKDTGRRRAVRYYTSQKAIKQGFASCEIKSLNAHHIDDLIRALVLDYLLSEHRVDLRPLESARRDVLIRSVVDKVELAPDRLSLMIDASAIDSCTAAAEDCGDAASPGSAAIPSCPFKPSIDTRGKHVSLALDVQIKKLDGKRILLDPEGRDLLSTVDTNGNPIPKPELIAAIGQAFMLQRHQLESGKTVKEVGAAFGYSRTHTSRMLTVAHLGPPVLRAVLQGTASGTTTVLDLLRAATHLDWSRQAEHLGVKLQVAERGAS
ncbi:MAG: recombinase family protein [Phycisphaerales bacterium]